MKRHSLPVIATLLISITAYAFLWLDLRPRVFASSNADFACFYRAGRMAVNGDGSRVYDLAAERAYDRALGTSTTDERGQSVSLPFVFAPFALPLFAALSMLTYPHAALAWYVLNVGVLLAWPFLLRTRMPLSNVALAVVLLVPALFFSVTLALLQGQMSFVLLLLFTLVSIDLANGKDARAGCWLALATVKPQFVLPMLLALVVWRKWRSIRSFAWSCLGLLALSLPIVGWHGVLTYPRALTQFSRLAAGMGGEHLDSMPNLRGTISFLLNSYVSAGSITIITLAASLLLLIAMTLVLRRHRISALTFSLVVLVGLIASYHSYLHDDVLLLLPFALTTEDCRRQASRLYRGVTIAAAASLLLAPLIPCSLSETAFQTSILIAAWILLLGWKVLGEQTSSNGDNQRAAIHVCTA